MLRRSRNKHKRNDMIFSLFSKNNKNPKKCKRKRNFGVNRHKVNIDDNYIEKDVGSSNYSKTVTKNKKKKKKKKKNKTTEFFEIDSIIDYIEINNRNKNITETNLSEGLFKNNFYSYSNDNYNFNKNTNMVQEHKTDNFHTHKNNKETYQNHKNREPCHEPNREIFNQDKHFLCEQVCTTNTYSLERNFGPCNDIQIPANIEALNENFINKNLHKMSPDLISGQVGSV